MVRRSTVTNILVLAASAGAVKTTTTAKGKGPRRGGLNAFQRAAATVGLATVASSSSVHPKFDDTQTELALLLSNPEAMQTRFQDFVTEKDGLTGDVMPISDTVQRYDAFKYNVQKAYERNEKSSTKGGQVVHGINGLSDLTTEQFHKMLGYIPHAHTDKTPATRNADGSVGKHWADGLPEVVAGGDKDWRDAGAVTDVKDQARCGSCWAFSATESVESAALVQGLADQFAPFVGSPQELVSCDKSSDEGCHGGLPENAFQYLQSKPMETEDDYPYEGADDTCMLDRSEGKFKVDQIFQVAEMGEGETDDLLRYIQHKGPASIGVAANDDWQTYVGGIMDVDTCPADRPDHAVQLVGVSLSSETPYWTVRNSWASSWGEDGFIRLTYGDNTCNIAFDATAVTVKKYDGASSSSSSGPFRATKFLQV